VADDSLIVSTGAFTRFGDVSIDVTPALHHTRQISDHVVEQIIGIDSGDVYREQRLIDAQRSLYETDAYQHVSMELDSAHGERSNRVGRDSIAPLAVSLLENTMHAARLGVGYGTLDCFRVSSELDNYNFLKGARRLEVRARLSKIGIGRPLGGAPNLCPQAQQDPYSTRLNYYLAATLRQPIFLGLRTVPTFTAFTQRVSEYNAYVRTTLIGGVASLAWRQSGHSPVTLSYTLDFGRTEAQPSLFCAVFNLCTSEDRERVQTNQRLGVVSLALSHDGSNSATSPTRGSVTRFELRHASPLVLSDTALQFNTLIGDAAHYIPLWDGAVLALHIRAGAVFGRGFGLNTGFIPPQERMYGGGPTSVRGFRQNELGAIAYIAGQYQTVQVDDSTYRFADTSGTYRRAVPLGGNSLLVGNAELRLRSPFLSNLLQFAIFADAGDVWNRGLDSAFFGNFKLKVTPGVQVAALTPIGPVRLVIGYNPYRRPKGPLYYENTIAEGGSLPCVSPGNDLPVHEAPDGTMVQAEGRCSATFQPAPNTSFRSRLTFSLAIGQAF
jgi:outer membrane protein insertion porin family/translocation and assembly module TamA